jgi:hypothetical protein
MNMLCFVAILEGRKKYLTRIINWMEKTRKKYFKEA